MSEHRNNASKIRTMMITAVIFGLIVLVAYSARQKVTNWVRIALADVNAAC
jgi:hypothetical protein